MVRIIIQRITRRLNVLLCRTCKSRTSQKTKDMNKEKYLRNNGYQLIIFWESQIVANPQEVVNEIKKIKPNKPV